MRNATTGRERLEKRRSKLRDTRGRWKRSHESKIREMCMERSDSGNVRCKHEKRMRSGFVTLTCHVVFTPLNLFFCCPLPCHFPCPYIHCFQVVAYSSRDPTSTVAPMSPTYPQASTVGINVSSACQVPGKASLHVRTLSFFVHVGCFQPSCRLVGH